MSVCLIFCNKQNICRQSKQREGESVTEILIITKFLYVYQNEISFNGDANKPGEKKVRL